ncbi:hypothetical protein FGO68_gene12368 [Halteria grandinella]|uniref:Uncharacterized protein n=1 Tax=Halteria grandinella TaxID=5974 RepID=A0A8J8T9V9_HALGN|nr:hypothetical protein FGO68_gene12368 [Halteria grandinella]
MALDYAFPITPEAQVSLEKRLGGEQDKPLKQVENLQVSSRSAPVFAQTGNEPSHTEHCKMINVSREGEARQNIDPRINNVSSAGEKEHRQNDNADSEGKIAQQNCNPNYKSVLDKSQDNDFQKQVRAIFHLNY